MIDEAFGRLEPLLGTKVACAAVGQSRSLPTADTQARSHCGLEAGQVAPPNTLDDAEVDDILAVLRSERFVDCSPAQVYFTLLDEGSI